jgi:hypothetical protein
MENKFEKLGQLIDELDNLSHSLQIRIPAQTHLEQMRIALPEKVKELKLVFIEITGDNPWD